MFYRIKSVSTATALLLIFTQVPAYAEPSLMLGLALNFGGGESRLGATAKVLSDNAPDKIVGAAGVTYFFDDKSFGLDAGLGYTFDGGAVTLTYDFTNQSPQISAGLADIRPRPRPIETVC